MEHTPDWRFLFPGRRFSKGTFVQVRGRARPSVMIFPGLQVCPLLKLRLLVKTEHDRARIS